MTALVPAASASWPSIRVTAWVVRLPPTKMRKCLEAARAAVSGGPVGVGSGAGLAEGAADVSTMSVGPAVPTGEGLEVQPAATNAATTITHRKETRRRIAGPHTRRSQVSRLTKMIAS